MQSLLGLLRTCTVWATEIWIEVLVASYAVDYGAVDARWGNKAFPVASTLDSLTLAGSVVLLVGAFGCEVGKALDEIKL